MIVNEIYEICCVYVNFRVWIFDINVLKSLCGIDYFVCYWISVVKVERIWCFDFGNCEVWWFLYYSFNCGLFVIEVFFFI